MRQIVTSIIALYVMTGHAQEAATPNCVPLQKVEELKNDLATRFQQYKDDVQQHRILFDQVSQARSAVAECLEHSRQAPLANFIDQFSSAMTLQRSKCDKLVEEHNELNRQLEESEANVEFDKNIVEGMAIQLRLANAAKCK